MFNADQLLDVFQQTFIPDFKANTHSLSIFARIGQFNFDVFRQLTPFNCLGCPVAKHENKNKITTSGTHKQ